MRARTRGCTSLVARVPSSLMDYTTFSIPAAARRLQNQNKTGQHQSIRHSSTLKQKTISSSLPQQGHTRECIKMPQPRGPQHELVPTWPPQRSTNDSTRNRQHQPQHHFPPTQSIRPLPTHPPNQYATSCMGCKRPASFQKKPGCSHILDSSAAASPQQYSTTTHWR